MMAAKTTDARLLALIVACGMLMAQLDGAVVTLALPAMASAFGATAVQVSVGITSYFLIQVILLPAAGWISDRFGARAVFASAVAVFTIASVLCALSPTLRLFVAARILQGAAAAMMVPVGRIALIQSTAKQDLVRVMTITTVPMLLAPSLGPALGGFITAYWSWRWIFLLNVPFGIAGTALAWYLIPASQQQRPRPFDTVGFVLLGGASALVLHSLERLASDYPHWLAPMCLMGAGMAVAAVAVRRAWRHPHPLVSLAATRISSFSITVFGGGSLIRVPLRALPYLLPLMCQLALGMNALRAGVLLLALNGGDLTLKSIATLTLRRFGFRNVLLVTALVSALSLAACAAFSLHTPYAVIFAVLAISGMMRSLLFTGMSTLTFADIQQDAIGSASIIWNMVLQAGNSLAVSVSAVLLAASAQLGGEARGQLSLRDFRVAFLVMAVIGLASLPSLRRLPADAGAHVSGHRRTPAG